MVFSKKISSYIYAFFLIAFAHSVIFAMDPSKRDLYNQLWQYAQSDQTFFELKDLIQKGDVDIHSKNEAKQTALHIAAMHGAESIVSYLLDLKNDQLSKPSSSYENNLNNLKIEIDAQDILGYTALHLAIINNHLNIARMLIKAGAKLNVTEETCWHILYFAAEYAKDKEFVKWIIAESKNDQFDINNLAKIDDDEESDGHLLDYNLGKTPLMVATQAGNIAAVEALLEAEAQITRQGYYELCALHCAAFTDDKKCVQLIIKESKKAQMHIDAPSSETGAEGDTALILACRRLNGNAVEAFLEAGANVNAANDHKQTPLHEALEESYKSSHAYKNSYSSFIEKDKKIIRLLLESGANIYSPGTHISLVGTYIPLAGNYSPLASALVFAHSSPSFTGIFTELLCWGVYRICTGSTPPENIVILQSIKNLYLLSSKYQALRQAKPLLEWIFTELIDCTSKKQLLEKILQYLETADEEKQRVMIENIDSLLLKEDILNEFKLNLNAFKKKFSSVEKLKSIFRYVYAQKMQKEIFNNFSEDLNSQLMNLTARKKDTQSFLNLKTAKDFMINYCNNYSLESPLLKVFLTGNDSSQKKKMVDLARCLLSNSNPNKDIRVSEKAVLEILDKRIDDVFEFIKELKMHLDYIIEKKGICLKSNTQFGQKKVTDQPKDILSF